MHSQELTLDFNLYSPLWVYAEDRVEIVVKVHCVTVLGGTNLPPCCKWSPWGPVRKIWVSAKWEVVYDHVPDSALKSKDYKMLWDFSIRTCHEIYWSLLKREHLPNYRLGISGWWKGESKRGRESRKISRSRERNPKNVGRNDKGDAHSCGGLGTIPLRLKENLRTIGVDTSIELIQRCQYQSSSGLLGKKTENTKYMLL